MSNEYIRKADAIDILDDFQAEIENGEGNYSWAKFKMNELEPADVAPVAHGRWIDADSHLGYFANCSACGYQMDVHAERGYFNFCPNCGAKMDGGY